MVIVIVMVDINAIEGKYTSWLHLSTEERENYTLL